MTSRKPAKLILIHIPALQDRLQESQEPLKLPKGPNRPVRYLLLWQLVHSSFWLPWHVWHDKSQQYPPERCVCVTFGQLVHLSTPGPSQAAQDEWHGLQM